MSTLFEPAIIGKKTRGMIPVCVLTDTITASAPGRAGIIGNPTDMYSGSVISCSVGERAHCRLSPSDELVISVGDESEVIHDLSCLYCDIGPLQIAKAALEALDIDPEDHRFSMQVWTDVPERAGLGGSTSMLSCVVGCLLTYIGLELNRYETAEMIRKIEADIMKVTCGYQDSYMAVFGGLNYMDFREKQWMRQSADEPYATIEPLGDMVRELPMILAHTGVKHSSDSVHKTLRERWREGEKKVVDAYRRIGEIGRLGKKALLAHDWETLGVLMNENHAIQRDLGGSGESNEVLIDAALQNGALGAKLAGAGGGGTIIALAENPRSIGEALLAAGADRVFGLQPSEGLIVEREL